MAEEARDDARKAGQKLGLGRGLSALLGEEGGSLADNGAGRAQLAVAAIEPNALQPRRHFEESELEDLARSIAERGVLQPILVRPVVDRPGRYQIIAGERRWRAAQRARLHEIPVIIRELTDAEALEIALIENVQRTDLNAIEEGAGYRTLMERFGYTQDHLAKMIGKSRSHIANTMRLLTLPENVRALVSAGRLTAGHARALIGLAEAEVLARAIVAKDLTVRQAEALAQRSRGARTKSGAHALWSKDPDTEELEKNVSAALGMKVSVVDRGAKGGEVRVAYKTLEQLDEVCRRLCHDGKDA